MLTQHSSVEIDKWAEFISSPLWNKFKERIYANGGLASNELKAVSNSVRNGDSNSAAYHQGIVDGIHKLFDLTVQFHKELQQNA